MLKDRCELWTCGTNFVVSARRLKFWQVNHLYRYARHYQSKLTVHIPHILLASILKRSPCIMFVFVQISQLVQKLKWESLSLSLSHTHTHTTTHTKFRFCSRRRKTTYKLISRELEWSRKLSLLQGRPVYFPITPVAESCHYPIPKEQSRWYKHNLWCAVPTRQSWISGLDFKVLLSLIQRRLTVHKQPVRMSRHETNQAARHKFDLLV